MDDVLERFRALLASASAVTGDGGCELLLSQLPPATARGFRLCAIPHQFDPGILAVLLPESPEDERQAIYNRLERLALVSPRGTMLAIHDSARTYLFKRWLATAGAEFHGASERLRVFFDGRETGASGQDRSDTLRQRMFHWIGADQSAGVAEFERLCRADRKAARFSDCASLIALVHEYDAILTAPNQGRLMYHEAKLAADRNDLGLAERIFQSALANTALPPELQMKTRNRLGLLYSSERRWDDAIAALESAQAIARGLDHSRQLPIIIHDLAVAWRGKGNRERSQELLEEAIKLADAQQNLLCLATAWNSLGTLHRSFHEYKKAVDAYNKSLAYLERMGEFRQAAVYNNLGDVYAELTDWKTSRNYFEKSLAIGREAADTIGQAKTLTNLIRVYANSNQEEDAIRAGTTAVNYFLALHDEYNAAAAMLRIAKIHRSAKRFPEALEAYGKSIDLYTAAGDNQAAKDVEEERRTVTRPVRLPWWAWAGPLLILLVLVVVFVVLALRNGAK